MQIWIRRSVVSLSLDTAKPPGVAFVLYTVVWPRATAEAVEQHKRKQVIDHPRVTEHGSSKSLWGPFQKRNELVRKFVVNNIHSKQLFVFPLSCNRSIVLFDFSVYTSVSKGYKYYRDGRVNYIIGMFVKGTPGHTMFSVQR